MLQQHGYFLEQPYTYGVYPETFPRHLRLVSLLAGHRPPAPARNPTVIEFGCGQGLNLCLQAALHPEGRFVGVDLSASHVGHASELAAAAGLSNLDFVQADLIDLAAGGALPPALEAVWGQCHFAVAQGVLGWASPEVGKALQVAATAALTPGGLLYLSYNTLPGWLAELPFQHALLALGRRQGGAGHGLDPARKLFEQIHEADSPLVRALPELLPRLQSQGQQSRNYLLHEYAHAQWQPLYADQVIEACAEQGLVFLGTTDLPALFPALLPEPYQELIRQQPDVPLQQLVRDLLVNQAFRRDVYALGKVPLWSGEAAAALGQIRVQGSLEQAQVEADDPLLFELDGFEVRLPRSLYRDVLRRLQHGPASLAELRACSSPPMPLPDLLTLVVLLIQSRQLQLLDPPEDADPARRLNALLLERVAAGAPYRLLATPAQGGAILLQRLELLALRAFAQGHRDEQLVTAVAETMEQLNMSFSATSTAADAPPGDLRQWLHQFQQEAIPHLRQLGVVASAI